MGFMSEPSLSIHELHGETAWMNAYKAKAQQKKKLRKLISGSDKSPVKPKAKTPVKIKMPSPAKLLKLTPSKVQPSNKLLLLFWQHLRNLVILFLTVMMKTKSLCQPQNSPSLVKSPSSMHGPSIHHHPSKHPVLSK